MKAEQLIRRKLYVAHRKAIGTQTEVAKKLEIGRATLQRKEKGIIEIKTADLYALFYLSPLDRKENV